ncbi:MAG: hypothetical protein NTU73_00230 [Ignavibacteriae bacterium]|nr:hypothetical protein [Ignavibacteriota bacterium]
MKNNFKILFSFAILTSFYINNIYTQTIIYPRIVRDANEILIAKQNTVFNKKQKIVEKKIYSITEVNEKSNIINEYFYDRSGNEIKHFEINTGINDTAFKTFYEYDANNYILSKKYYFMGFKNDYKLDSHYPDKIENKKIERLIENKYNYDKNYNLVEELEYNNGELCHKKEFTYDEEGRLTDEAIFGKDYNTRKIFASNSGCVSDTIYRHYWYGFNGQEKEMASSEYGNVYEYNNSDKDIKITVITDKKDRKYEIVKLDDNKNILSKESFLNDTSKWINKFAYDENGNLIEDNFKFNVNKIHYFDNNFFNVEGTYYNKLYLYNTDGSIAEINVKGFIEKEMFMKWIYYYDKNGLLIEKNYYSDSDIPDITKYQYIFYDN